MDAAHTVVRPLHEGEDRVSVIKRTSFVVLGALTLMLGGVTAARAADTVTAKVPFAFVVNGTVLPAGDYVVARDTAQPNVISITSADGAHTTLVLTRGSSRDGAKQPTLEFSRLGTQMYLSEVVLSSGNSRELIVPGN
jgi:hypothetical protein